MKNKILYGLLSFLVIGLLPMVFVSAENEEKIEKEKATISIENTNADLQMLIERLQSQIKGLQEQLAKLKAEIAEVKEELRLTKNLYKGLSDEEVKKLQEFLKQYTEIYPEGLVTGFYGPLTEKAVKKFQEAYNIPATGFVGPLTRDKVKEISSENKITICHYPPENPSNKHAIEIAEPSLQAHLIHGDTTGPCPEEPTSTPAPSFAPAPTPVPVPTSTPSAFLPDIEAFSLMTQHIYVNESNAISAGFKNVGLAVIPRGFITKYYVDGNYAGEGEQTVSHAAIVAPTNSGGSNSGARPVNYTFTATGNHEIKAILDANNTIPEIYETNNTIIKTVNIVNPSETFDDLEVLNMYPSHHYANQSNYLYVRLGNRGTRTAPTDLVVKLYMDGNYIGEQKTWNDLLPGNGTTLTIPFVFDGSGTHEVKVVVDATDLVSENSEENNILIQTMAAK